MKDKNEHGHLAIFTVLIGVPKPLAATVQPSGFWLANQKSTASLVADRTHELRAVDDLVYHLHEWLANVLSSFRTDLTI